MRGMPFQYKGQGVLEISALASICSEQENWKQKKKKHQEEELSGSCNNEPTSVLHMRRSPSPPTSASTLSSSFPGGGASADNTAVGVAELHPIPAANELRKDEWVTELQPIASGLEVVTGGGGGRCGLGLEDWESMLSESAASPSQELSLLKWISGDIDDASFGLKQLLQSGNNVPLDFEGNAGLGIVDQGFPGGSAIFSSSGAGISTGTIDNGNGKMGIPSSSSGVINNYKVSNTGLNNNNNNNNNFNLQTPVFPVSLPSGMIFQQFESPDEKPQILNPEMGINQNPNLFLPLAYNPQEQQHFLQPQPKRHNSSCQIPSDPFSDPGHEFLLRKHNQQQPHHMGFPPPGLQFLPQQLEQKPFTKSKIMEEIGNQQQQQQQHALLDQLYKAAELVGTGNFQHAQGILARLNHQLSPVGKPLHRAAFYFKEALQLLILMHQHNPVTSPPPRTPTPFDVIFKMGAYKVFSEVSPIIHFVNFTCNQALLEALDDADRIHIVDFDIGFGVQWASFMQELPVRNRGVPSLKITAFASPSTHHPVELELMRENLTQFANEIGVNFELQVINFDSLDQNAYSLPIFRTENEAIAVNFPIWSSSNQPAVLPTLLRIVKQLSPKIVVSLDRGCDRSDLPFPQHILHALQSYINILESLDAVNLTSDAVNKIERFLLQPRIESTVLGRLRAPDKMPLWKTLFASAGFSPLKFSNFTETQAECVVKRTPVRGFHVEKRQASLVLCWQRQELISASAWRC